MRGGARFWGRIKASMLRKGLVLGAAVVASLAIGVSAASGFGFIATFGHSGNGNGSLDFPSAVDTDSAGNIYVADRANNRIEKFGSGGNFIKVFGTSGSGLLSQPRGVTVSPANNVYVADQGHDQIVEFTSNGDFVRKWGSFGKDATPSHFDQPYGVHATGTFLYVADFGNFRVSRFNLDGTAGTIIVNSSDDADISFLNDVTTDTSNIYVADSGNDQIRKYQIGNGTHVADFGSNGSANGQFNDPYGVSYDGAGNLWVADSQNTRIQLISTAGTFRLKWGGQPSGSCNKQLAYPEGVEALGTTQVLVADTLNDRIVKLGNTGNANPSCHGGGSGGGGGAATKCAGKPATIFGTAGADNLTGTKKADVAILGAGNDKFNAKGGKDVVCGGGGKDTLIGKGGKDKLIGQAGNDKLPGGAGNDKVLGKGGNDKLKGGAGPNDTCKGGAGAHDHAAASCETILGVP